MLVLEKRAEHGPKLDLDVEPELGPELGPEMELELELEHELELCWFESASFFFLVKSHSAVDSVSVVCLATVYVPVVVYLLAREEA